MEDKNLFLCNSVYQLFVTLWIRTELVPDISADLIITNHTNDGKKLVRNIKSEYLFDNVYYVESLDYARYRTGFTKKDRYLDMLIPGKRLKKYWHEYKKSNKYSTIFMANTDRFSQLLFGALARCNSNIKVTIYEDGLYTYSELFVDDIRSTSVKNDNLFKSFLYKYLFKYQAICDNIHEINLFHPKDLDWIPSFHVTEIKKIDCNKISFRNLCNRIFEYNYNSDCYDRKYIFMEESFAAEGVPINDIELLTQLAIRVGKENIMVKIHPRNPCNRFLQHGFKTNQNTSIPWELIVMNLGDISNKTLITIGSSSVLNPMLIFGKSVKVYSLYNLVDKASCKSRLLSGTFWNTIYKIFLGNSNMITICNSLDEIE